MICSRMPKSDYSHGVIRGAGQRDQMPVLPISARYFMVLPDFSSL